MSYVIFRIRLDPEKKYQSLQIYQRHFFRSLNCQGALVTHLFLSDVLKINTYFRYWWSCAYLCINHWGTCQTHGSHFILSWFRGNKVVHINHRDCAKGCHYRSKSYFNNIKCSFKSFLSNLEMFILNLVNKPAVTMMVTKIIYFAQSQKRSQWRRIKIKKSLTTLSDITYRNMETFTENN